MVPPADIAREAVLEARQLHKHFAAARTGWRRRAASVRAVDGVNLRLMAGEVLALVGESGSGKSTLALALLGLEKPSAGRVLFRGCDMAGTSARDWRQLRRQIQMIFQDPYESLNPTMRVEQIVREPLEVHDLAVYQGRICAALEEVGLRPAVDFLRRYPSELSGGQRQRVAIAAALVLEPAVLLADEPVSMLDVSVRAEILNLLSELSRQRGMAIALITHDLAAAACIADRLAVMYLGRIVERGPARAVIENPQHPYTRALVQAAQAMGEPLKGEAVWASQQNGCRFYNRCPLALARCAEADPGAVEVGPEHCAACWLVGANAQGAPREL